MKLIHTSDWHLGHALYRYDRMEEQRSMMEQMVALVRDERPDALLISGDVYHSSQPSAAAQTLFAEGLAAMHAASPGTIFVVTAGNHDSGTRHDIFQTPWRALNVYTVGQIDREHPERHLVEAPGKGWIVAVPYCYERMMPDGFYQRLLDKALSRAGGLPVALMAHATVAGCDSKGHDDASDLTVGGIDALPLDYFGTGYDYLALGHIHHAQYVAGSDRRARYSGSPLPVGFDEAYEHSVTLVELAGGGEPPAVRVIPLENPRPLVTLPSDGALSWADALAKLADMPSDLPAYIRLRVAAGETLPSDATARADAAVQGKACRFCYLQVERPETSGSAPRSMTVGELRAAAPIDILRRYTRDTGRELSDELENLFAQAAREAEEDARK